MDGTPAYKERDTNLVGVFREGLAAVARKDGAFHIKPDGTPAYKERYDWVNDFKDNGLAWVNKNGEGFHIKTDGQRVD